MTRVAAASLVAWGLFHAVGATMLTREVTGTALTPGLRFLSLVVVMALVTVVGGAGVWSGRRWALATGIIGVAGLWLVPLAFVIHRLGHHGVSWFHHVAKLAISAGIVALAIRATTAISRARWCHQSASALPHNKALHLTSAACQNGRRMQVSASVGPT